MTEPSGGPKRQFKRFFWAVAALVLCFGQFLYRWALFGASSDLYSYTLLIPVISAYLVWIKEKGLPNPGNPETVLAGVCAVVGATLLSAYLMAANSGVPFQTANSLAVTTASFVLFFWAVCAWFLGAQFVRSIAFQLGFLILMAPIPVSLKTTIESQLQHYSALSALGLFEMTGMPVYYSDLRFDLSDISLQVAPECSGIHSSLALLITSLVAGYIFLQSNWKRSVLALSVVPLAIFRNGFRIFTLGELCVHIGPQMIDSRIHHHGGPIFFVLSLVPFLGFLFLLIRSERRTSALKTILDEA